MSCGNREFCRFAAWQIDREKRRGNLEGGKQAIYTYGRKGKDAYCLLQAKTRLELKDSRRPRGDATLQGVHATTVRGWTRQNVTPSHAERPSQVPAMVQEMAFKSGERGGDGAAGAL